MPLTRTPAELETAVGSMFRVRAVESPPEPDGSRTIWHRGAKGADLVSWVDAFGRVSRQELYLFDECLTWERAAGIRTGLSDPKSGSVLAAPAQSIAYDEQQNKERLKRAGQALSHYQGDDKFIGHLRGLLQEALAGTSGAFERAAITRPLPVVREDLLNAELKRVREEQLAEREASRRQWTARALWAAAAVLLVLALYLMFRP